MCFDPYIMDKVTVVKYSFENEKFEILVKPDPAFDYKLGKISEISKILVSDEIYTDSGKGKRASSELLLKAFKTCLLYTSDAADE